jgi:ATP-binding cassette, subfamily B, heavy metal transporter
VQFVLYYFAARVLLMLVSIVENVSKVTVESDARRRFAVHVFEHMHSLSLAYHLERRTGEVIRVVERGVQSVTVLTNVFFFTLFPTLFEACLVSFVFFKLGSLSIALATLGSVIVYVIITIAVTGWRKKFRRETIDADNAAADKLFESLTNYETVSTFGRTTDEASAYNGLRNTLASRYVRMVSSMELLNSLQSLIRTSGLCVGLCLAAIATVTAVPRLGPGDFILVQLLIGQLYTPLAWLGSTYRQVIAAFTDLEKVSELLLNEPQISDRPGAPPLKAPAPPSRASHVEFKNVSFGYKSSQRATTPTTMAAGVSNITFTIKPGETLAM